MFDPLDDRIYRGVLIVVLGTANAFAVQAGWIAGGWPFSLLAGVAIVWLVWVFAEGVWSEDE